MHDVNYFGDDFLHVDINETMENRSGYDNRRTIS